MTRRGVQPPAPGTFAARRAEREAREVREGVAPRRRLTLQAGDGTAEHDFTITATNDDDPGSAA